MSLRTRIHALERHTHAVAWDMRASRRALRDALRCKATTPGVLGAVFAVGLVAGSRCHCGGGSTMASMEGGAARWLRVLLLGGLALGRERLIQAAWRQLRS